MRLPFLTNYQEQAQAFAAVLEKIPNVDDEQVLREYKEKLVKHLKEILVA